MYIPISYPIQKKPFHYTFKEHELHTHFIIIHFISISHSFHYIPISYPFKGHDYIPIHYNSFTTHFVPKTMMNKVKKLVRS